MLSFKYKGFCIDSYHNQQNYYQLYQPWFAKGLTVKVQGIGWFKSTTAAKTAITKHLNKQKVAA